MSASVLRVSLLLAITFGAGVAAGVAADRMMGRPADAAPTETPNPAAEGGATIERFADELGLTEQQREEIAPIVTETRRRMMELFGTMRPAYRSVVDSARAEIEAILAPEQIEEYRKLLVREYGPDALGGEEVETPDE